MERQGVVPGNINWQFSDFRERRYCSYSFLDSFEQRHTDGGASVESSEGHAVVSTYRHHIGVPLRVVRLQIHHTRGENVGSLRIRILICSNRLQTGIRSKDVPQIRTLLYNPLLVNAVIFGSFLYIISIMFEMSRCLCLRLLAPDGGAETGRHRYRR
jgi:hypothetical protein